MDIKVDDLDVSTQSVLVDEARFARLEAMVEMLVQQGLADKKKADTSEENLTESFADGRLAQDLRAQASPQKKERRSSLMLKDVLFKTPDTVSTHVYEHRTTTRE